MGNAPEPGPSSADSLPDSPSDSPSTPLATQVTTAAAPATELTVSGDITNDEQFRSAMNSYKATALNLACYKRNSDPSNPMSYRLLRTGLWANLSDKINTSALQAPNTTAMPDWQALIDAGEPLRLLESAEKMLVKNFFFLDLNRYSTIALDALGHSEASAAVQHELRLFIRRFPQLPDATFKGNVPVANDATRIWIQSQILADDSGSSENTQPLTGTLDSTETSVQEVMKMARDLASSGDRRQAVQSIETQIRQANCEKDRFVWRLRLIRFFLHLDEGEFALSTVERMNADIKEFKLDRWDPVFALDVANLACQVAAKVQSNAALRQRAQTLMNTARAQICYLEPSAAIERLTKSRN